MSDVLERLRELQEADKSGGPVGFVRDIWKCAADEIARLRIELRDWQDSSEAYRADAERLRVANEKLVEALRRISKGEISGKGVVARAALREH